MDVLFYGSLLPPHRSRCLWRHCSGSLLLFDSQSGVSDGDPVFARNDSPSFDGDYDEQTGRAEAKFDCPFVGSDYSDSTKGIDYHERLFE